MPCFTAMRAEIALMSGSAFAVTHHAFSSGAGRTSDGNGSHASTLKSPSYTKSVSWQHYRNPGLLTAKSIAQRVGPGGKRRQCQHYYWPLRHLFS
ncbi:transposase [Shigella flexneri K-227]|uniref:Transposase n=1 Tax=Shigella flexneri K-227 TaxID=766147 RepID=F5NSS9_SHIFL|nr:transposase [Shigella flexneri K-272]EGK39510.1 transposase [Shigella flexneri K-227]